MILLLDTSAPVCRAVLLDGDIRIEREWQADRTLAKHLLKFLTDLLVETGHTIRDLTGIGVMMGPGSFTGLRIGLAVCNTLADGLQIPIVGTRGDTWQEQAITRLDAGETDQIVLPHYGSAAHITQPRK